MQPVALLADRASVQARCVRYRCRAFTGYLLVAPVAPRTAVVPAPVILVAVFPAMIVAAVPVMTIAVPAAVPVRIIDRLRRRIDRCRPHVRRRPQRDPDTDVAMCLRDPAYAGR